MSDVQLRKEERGATVLSQLRICADEYNTWDEAYCADKLSSLKAPDSALARLSSRAVELDALINAGEDDNAAGPSQSQNTSLVPSMTCWTVGPEGHIEEIKQLHPKQIVLAPEEIPTPYPSYESCTPVSRNILHGDDPNLMAFLPLADHPTFNYNDYLDVHKGLAWQDLESRGPDVLEVTLETARRLHYEHGLSLEDIDETRILPLPLRTGSVGGGAISTGNANDSMPWPGSSRLEHPPLPDLAPPAADDLRSRLRDYLTLWCRRPDCLQAHCFTHATEEDVQNFDHPGRLSTEPFYLLPVAEPCGADCAAHHPSVSEDDVVWTNAEIDELQVMCHIAPPTLPCDLAKLCLKPCYEVAVVSQRFVSAPAGSGTQISASAVAEGSDGDRGRGCTCKAVTIKTYKRYAKEKTVPPCTTDACPCRKDRRECDARLCAPCGMDCANMQLQRSAPKIVEVKRGMHGMGLFLCEDVRRGELVIEYVGELIYEPTELSRSEISQALGRFYVFGLPPGDSPMSVDSMYAGNPARFINHAPSRRANVTVHIFKVDGEHRIGIYANKNMAAGTELLMDYGPEFLLET